MSNTIEHISQLNLDQHYSYADYLLWKLKERVELIRGRIREMAAPNTEHQIISGTLHGLIWTHLRKTPCKVFSAPFDVRLSPVGNIPDQKIYNVVQPDITIVCDPSKLDAKGCIGAPDLVVEILSPGNNQKELRDKFELYESNGITEYWIVSPAEQTFQMNSLVDRKYHSSKLYTTGDQITSSVLPGFILDLDEIFERL
jgi:Uma2 family endonuclease